MNTLLTIAKLSLSLSNAVTYTYLKQYKHNGMKIQKVFLAAAIVIAASLLTQQRTVSSAPNYTFTHNPTVFLRLLFHSKFLIRVMPALPEVLMIWHLVFKEDIKIRRIFLSSPDTRDKILKLRIFCSENIMVRHLVPYIIKELHQRAHSLIYCDVLPESRNIGIRIYGYS
jgi:hypothetical protein